MATKEGILAIVAFAIMFALPNIILYRKGEFKKFTTVQLIFGAIQLSFVVFLMCSIILDQNVVVMTLMKVVNV